MTLAPRPGDESTASAGLLLVYDAWNRLVKVYQDNGATSGQKDSGDTLVAKYRYDGQGRQIQKVVAGSPDVTYDYYYNENWQAVEVRRDGDADPLDQYVWDPRYVDAPLVRFHDANTDGDYLDSGDNVLYYCQDANWNVTAVVSAGGSVVERYMYAAYGKATVLEADWSADADGASDVANARLFQGEELNPETGLYSSRVRTTYHPTLGVFTSRDPAGYIDGSNVYQYCLSNPAGGTDPMGLCFGTAPDLNFHPLAGHDRQC